MPSPQPSYIVVEGPIGVGKTTLAERLAERYSAEAVLERPASNPFLEKFYQSPRQHALATQLFFLLHRAEQLNTLALSHDELFARVRVSDFLVQKDRLFAELTLTPDELQLYEQVARHIVAAPPRPDLVIYLQAPVAVLRERIAARGIDYERSISTSYLEQLVGAYTRFFHDYSESPLVIVNAAEVDFANNPAHFEFLFGKLKSLTSGRHYLNPAPFLD